MMKGKERLSGYPRQCNIFEIRDIEMITDKGFTINSAIEKELFSIILVWKKPLIKIFNEIDENKNEISFILDFQNDIQTD
ncbi:MAG: hypothetical protein GY828_03670, partial [Candidatus Gracilibacteria bacterium]|nr:hypothetical protein [Candidatus Gracilibacteria bacterium]